MLYISSLPNNTETAYDINITNVENYFVDKSKSIIMWQSGGWNTFDNLSTAAPKATSIGTLYNGSWIILSTDYDNKKVKIGTGTDRRSLSAYVCILYTLTTDTANS